MHVAIEYDGPHDKSGRYSVECLNALARRMGTPAPNRSPVLPRVPTAHEPGLTDFEASNWIGLFVPRATPAAIIRRLSEATIAAMNTPSLGERAQAIGTDLVAPERRGPEYLERFVASEIDKWAALIRASGISVD
jgi:tripartite-type tricarboxylate transporter receptor subunit TctC